MSTNRMDVFDLRRAVVDEYRGFATSFTRVFAPDIKTCLLYTSPSPRD